MRCDVTDTIVTEQADCEFLVTPCIRYCVIVGEVFEAPEGKFATKLPFVMLKGE
jgi:hypothetical protein